MIDIHVTTEYDTLRAVVMRYAAAPLTVDLSRPELLDPVHQRQLATSSWEPYDVGRVRSQQDALIELLRARGVEVLLADRAAHGYAQHFTRDVGFVVDDTFIVGRLNSPRRQPEIRGVRAVVDSAANVAELDAGTIEGGDVALHRDMVLVGLSEETSMLGVESLRRELARRGSRRRVVPIGFACPGVVHLDDHFLIVGPDLALLHPRVFTRERLRWFHENFLLIPISDQEALGVEANVLAVAPSAVVLDVESHRIAAALETHGIEPLPIDYSEVTKIPGGFRCTTLPVRRTGPAPMSGAVRL